MSKERIAGTVKEETKDELKELVAEKDTSISEAVRESIRDWIRKNRTGTDREVWRAVPETLQNQVKEILRSIRNYQIRRDERPFDFSAPIKKSESVIEIEGSEHIFADIDEDLNGKLNAAFQRDIFEIETHEMGVLKQHGEISLSELGKKLMLTLKDGNYDPEEKYGVFKEETETEEVKA